MGGVDLAKLHDQGVKTSFILKGALLAMKRSGEVVENKSRKTLEPSAVKVSGGSCQHGLT
jgi:hypothetical protein